ncbi:MAG: RlmE family RNA methyltransferase [Pseudomonadaceae bacterium]|nr:RlmE family RNA methyltransferase [Pseudomonadaceae bacterium]
MTGKLKGARTRFTNNSLSHASKEYLKRQSADPYVRKAHAQGYRSRAAYKLLEVLEKEPFLKPGMTVVDLGCAPGGWCQVAMDIVGEEGTVVGIDLLPTEPIAGVVLLEADFMADEGQAALYAELPEGAACKVDAVISDMAANTVGHRETDGMRTMALVEMAEWFALEHVKEGGVFLAKLFMNGEEKALMERLRPHFAKVKFIKPHASRADSREIYILAVGRKD